MAIKEFIIGPQNYWEEGYFDGDYTLPNVSKAFLECDIDNIKGGRVVTGLYYEDNYIDGTYWHDNSIRANMSVVADKVKEAQIQANGYLQEGYFDGGYFGQGIAVVLSVSAEKLILGDGVLVSESAISTQASKVIESSASMNTEFNQSSLAGKIGDIDLYAFSNGSLTSDITAIRAYQLDALSAFDIATDYIRQRDTAGDAEIVFNQDIVYLRNRDTQTETQVAFSFDVNETLFKEFDSQQSINAELTTDIDVTKEIGEVGIAAQATISCVISHIHGADVVVDNFADCQAIPEIIRDSDSQSNIESNTNIDVVKTTSIISNVQVISTFAEVPDLTFGIGLNVIREVGISIESNSALNLDSSVIRDVLGLAVNADADIYCVISHIHGADIEALGNAQLEIATALEVTRDVSINITADTAVSAVIERIQQGESQLSTETLGSIDYFNLIKPGNFDGNITTSLSSDVRRIRNITIGYIGDRTAKTISTYGNAQISTAQSKFGAASALITDTGDYFTVSGDSTLYNGNFTVEMWVWGTNLTQTPNGTIWDNRTSTSSGMYLYVSYGSIGLYEGITGKGLTSAGFNNSQWNHIAVVRNGTNIKVFVNGVQKISATVTTTNYSNRTTYIGSTYAGAVPLRSYYDEVRLSSSARYTTAFTPATSAFTSDSDVRALLHLDTNFSDDTAAVLGPEIISTASAVISKFADTTISLNLQSQLTAIVGTLESITLIVFNFASIQALPFSSSSTSANLTESSISSIDAVKTTDTQSNAVSSFDAINVINDRLRDVQSNNQVANDIAVVYDRFRRTDIAVNIEFAISAIIGKQEDIDLYAFADGNLAADVSVITDSQSQVSSQFSNQTDAGIVKSADAVLQSDVATSINGDRIRFASSAFESIGTSLIATDVIPAILINIGGEFDTDKPYAEDGYVEEEYATNFLTIANYIVDNQHTLESQFSVSVDTDLGAEGAAIVVSFGTINIDAVKTTSTASSNLINANTDINPVKSVVSSSDTAIEFTVVANPGRADEAFITVFDVVTLTAQVDALKTIIANVNSETTLFADTNDSLNLKGEAHLSSAFEQTAQGDKISGFESQLEAFAFQVTAAASERALDADLVSSFALSVTPTVIIPPAEANISAEFNQTAELDGVIQGNIAISSAMSFVSQVREIRTDDVVYIIPAEGWTYTITGEGREHTIIGETRLRKITAESRLKRINGESRIYNIE